ncbi:MAG: 2-amino-4-ketopentanoate thiolase [Firmicutes bacterium]|nr:2-amino-4-ketopentanoate thiolase [Bacillota bacterium]
MLEGKVWPKGTWVEISRIVLPPGERAPQVPADTAAVPLELRVKGFLQEPAAVGQEACITTLIGRTQRGKVICINPRHIHDFGEPVLELLTIGQELKQLLEGSDDAK